MNGAVQLLSNARRYARNKIIGLLRQAAEATPAHYRVQETERIQLGRDRMAVKAKWGGWIVVPTFNIDVALGVIRDGAIEPWTTRLIQELLKPGDVYLNAGANFGYYVALGGALVGANGTVIGVEPNPHILPFLFQTVFWSGLTGHARIYNRALSNSDGDTLSFQFDPQYLGGGSALEIWANPAGAPVTTGMNDAIWSMQSIADHFDESGRWRIGQGIFVPFSATTTTIDSICAGIADVAVIHLDIEGGEPFALRGAFQTIRRSSNLRLVTEWTERHYRLGSEASRKAFDEFWALASDMEYRVRRIEPRIAPNGGIYLSQPLDYAHMTTAAMHGDYVWVRKAADPWGG
jgi:FkbM family methyltransferase